MAKGKMGFEGGKYSAKSGDLSKSQLKRAGATKAAAKRTVDIGRTRRATEGVNKGKTLGAGGKPLTGSVKLANGQMAVYKAGKRVINVKRSGGGSNNGGGNPAVIPPAIITPVDPPKPPAPTGGSKAANRRNEIRAAGRMRAQNTATANTKENVAARNKIAARKKFTDARVKGRAAQIKAAKERAKRPSLGGAIRNTVSGVSGAASNYANWSRKTNQGIYDYFRNE